MFNIIKNHSYYLIYETLLSKTHKLLNKIFVFLFDWIFRFNKKRFKLQLMCQYENINKNLIKHSNVLIKINYFWSFSQARPSLLGSCNCDELKPIQCHLETKDLWEKFHDLGTEMIITKTGRWVSYSIFYYFFFRFVFKMWFFLCIEFSPNHQFYNFFFVFLFELLLLFFN